MANIIYLKTQDDVLLEVTRPRKLVVVGGSDVSVAYPVADYDSFGLVKIQENSGLTIDGGVLSPTDGYFVTVAQGAANAGKFLFVNSQGNVSLTQFSNMPTKTSDLVNDGDGTSPFVTQANLDDSITAISLSYIDSLFEEV